MCRLVLLGVSAAIYSDSKQVYVPAYAFERHRRGGHPPLLHHPHCRLSVSGRETCGIREQLPGEGGVGPPSSASSTDLLRDEVGPAFLRFADAWSDGEEVYT